MGSNNQFLKTHFQVFWNILKNYDNPVLRRSCEIMGAIGMFLQDDLKSGFSFKNCFTQLCPSPPPATPLSFDSLRNYTTVDLNRQTCQFWQR